MSTYVEWTGVPFLSVEYRLAPGAHGEEPSLDVFDALQWLSANAFRLGIDPDRIALMGDSAGGGIAAACAIRARDRGVAVAKQLLIYPMLDDRNTKTTDPFIAPFVTWSHRDNRASWHALLGAAVGTEQVSAYSAAARCTDHTGLPPAYIEVGTLDLFRDESINYATKLLSAGVEVELHLHPGCPHDYDWLAPTSELARSWRPQRIAAIESI